MSQKKSNEVLSVMKGLAISMIVMVHSGCTGWLFIFTSFFMNIIYRFKEVFEVHINLRINISKIQRILQ